MKSHQPSAGPVSRIERTPLERAELCRDSVIIVLATETGTEPLRVEFEDPALEPVVCDASSDGSALPLPRPAQTYRERAVVSYALEAACRTSAADVCVLCAPDERVKRAIAESIQYLERLFEREQFAAPAITVLPYDARADVDATHAAAHFEVYGLSKGLFDVARARLARHPHARSAVFMASDQVRLTADHLCDLQETFREDPTLDVVASWIVWLRRLPMLFSRTFLEGLDESPLCRPRAGAPDRPLPHLHAKDVVFGEEKLAANAADIPHETAFFADCTLSALEAVRLAKANADPEAHAARSDADRALIRLAQSVVAELDAHADDNLTWADDWGRRNKLDFPLLVDDAHRDTLVFLDSAATAQRLQQALEAQEQFDRHENANVYRGAYELSREATITFNNARKVLEDFIGADRRQTAYTANASDSCSRVALHWGEHQISEGDVIVTTIAEHHSNMTPWFLLARRKNARLVYLPVDEAGRIDLQAYEETLALKPRLVCLSHVGNVLGMELPVRTMIDRAHAAGARVMLDAAQSMPHLPLNVKELGADFVAFSAHKAYGPMGLGGLWISPDAFAEMDPLTGGGGTISHFATDSYYLRAGAIQYELGTPPVSQAVGFAAAIKRLQELGMENVARHGSVLTRFLVKGLRSVEGLTIWGDHEAEDGLTGLVAFSLRKASPNDIARILGKLDVAVRSGGHCALPLAARMGVIGTGRISFGIHNTREDIEAAVVALRLCSTLVNPAAENPIDFISKEEA